MKLTRKSVITGKTHTMELDVTLEQLANYEKGMLVQEAFPLLSPAEREFILTGTTPEEWDVFVKEPEDDDD